MTSQELLKIYSAYLPYGVKFKCIDIDSGEYEISTLKYINIPFEEIGVGYMEYDFTDLGQGELLMCLRPLSDLCQKIQVEGEETTWLEHLLNKNPRYFNYLTYKPMFNNYWEFEALVKNHFDVFGLIGKNLAINLNEVK